MMNQTPNKQWWQPVGIDRPTITRLILTAISWHVGSRVGTLWAAPGGGRDLLNPYETFASSVGAIVAPGSLIVLLATGVVSVVYIVKKLPVWITIATAVGTGLMSYIEIMTWRSR